MLDEIIGSILQAEAKAEEIVEAATAEAKSILQKAEQARVSAIAENNVRIKQDKANFAESLEKKLAVENEKILSKGREACVELTNAAKANSKPCVDFIVGSIINGR